MAPHDTAPPPTDYPLSERPPSLITNTPRPWDQPQFSPGAPPREQSRDYLDPAHAAARSRSGSRSGSEGGGTGSTILDQGFGELYRVESETSSESSPRHGRSPSQSRRSTADLVRDTGGGTLTDANGGVDSPPAPAYLERAITAALIKSAGTHKQDFLPIDAFRQIVTRDLVRHELARLVPNHIPKEKLDWYTDQVWDATPTPTSRSHKPPLTTRRKIFTILALLQKVDEIISFIGENLHDNDLPFLLSEGAEPGTRQLRRRGRDGKLHRIVAFSTPAWPVFMIEAFHMYQWRFLAPYFTLSTKEKPEPLHYSFEHGIVLPLIKDEEITSGDRGGYGDVWKVQFHPAHHNSSQDAPVGDINTSSNPCYAIKRLRHSNRDAFKAEVSNLKRFSTRDHLHLIKLLVTFEWRQQFYMLFPCADGNLLDFWKEYPNIDSLPRDEHLARWLSSQCLGLAEGLKMIHTVEFKHGDTLGIPPAEKDKKHGRHGDLKPENILWFRPIGAYCHDGNGNGCGPGVLKISDFGLTKFHGSASLYSKLEGKNTPVSPTYRAPEFDIDKYIDQSYDIWTLGCVMLEFVAWYLLGWNEVEEFSKKRVEDDERVIPEDVFFNNCFVPKEGQREPEPGARAKRSVYNEFEKLYHHANASDFILDLLDFIEDKLLRMGPWKRAKCDEIVKTLSTIHINCINDSRYCTERKDDKPHQTRTGLSLLTPSTLQYSDKQRDRIIQSHKEPMPLVPSQVEPPGPDKGLPPSPAGSSSFLAPRQSVSERIGHFRDRFYGDSSKRDDHAAEPPSRSHSPFRHERLPSVTITDPSHATNTLEPASVEPSEIPGPPPDAGAPQERTDHNQGSPSDPSSPEATADTPQRTEAEVTDRESRNDQSSVIREPGVGLISRDDPHGASTGQSTLNQGDAGAQNQNGETSPDTGKKKTGFLRRFGRRIFCLSKLKRDAVSNGRGHDGHDKGED